MSDIDLSDEIIEVGARALAMLTPNEDWPTNASLGGNATGTRDDEYHAAMHEQAHMVAAAITPLIEAAVRAQVARDIEATRERFAESSPIPSRAGSNADRYFLSYEYAASIARGEQR